MSMTKAREQTVVGEGLAIGVISLGVESVMASSQSLDFGFSHAWRHWTNAGGFPRIRAGVQVNDIGNILHKSEGRQGHIAAWRIDQRATPYIRLDNWSPQDVAEVLDGDVPLTSWVDLARLFLERAVV